MRETISFVIQPLAGRNEVSGTAWRTKLTIHSVFEWVGSRPRRNATVAWTVF